MRSRYGASRTKMRWSQVRWRKPFRPRAQEQLGLKTLGEIPMDWPDAGAHQREALSRDRQGQAAARFFHAPPNRSGRARVVRQDDQLRLDPEEDPGLPGTKDAAALRGKASPGALHRDAYGGAPAARDGLQGHHAQPGEICGAGIAAADGIFHRAASNLREFTGCAKACGKDVETGTRGW